MLQQCVYRHCNQFIVHIVYFEQQTRPTVERLIKSDGLKLIIHEAFKTSPLPLKQDIEHTYTNQPEH